MTRTRALALVLSSAALSAGPAAKAGPLIRGGVETLTASSYPANLMQGYDFVPTTDLSLTALGFWDSAADGLPRGFQVGVWAADTQALLASAVIDSADPLDPTVVVAGGSWRYETLAAPVALTAGTTYTLAFQAGAAGLSDADSLLISYPSLAVDPNVTVANQSRFLNTGGAFAFPTIALTAGQSFRGQANALLTPAGVPAVPEPASVTLLGLGAAGLAARRFRRAESRHPAARVSESSGSH